MSEDIHKWSDGRYTLMFDEHTFFVWDNEKEERMTALNVTKKLNEQQATISQLQDLCGESDSENAKLRIENEQLKNRLNEEYIKECSIK
jgi:regulator of replication initiation timing